MITFRAVFNLELESTHQLFCFKAGAVLCGDFDDFLPAHTGLLRHVRDTVFSSGS